ncbi:hypothetical protein [Streptomyces sp. NBC_00212]|uniref:hypothetical protein n=1 Tax=Streptomyces sp. NBC_00212 TaxID=2975684 RepID=UPI00324C3DBF
MSVKVAKSPLAVRVWPADSGGQVLVGAADGVVEGEGEFQEWNSQGEPSVQGAGPVDDVAASWIRATVWAKKVRPVVRP